MTTVQPPPTAPALPPRSIRTAAREVWAYRELLINLARRELRSRFRRSFLGWGWSFLQPLLMTAVYAIVLGTILRATPAPGDPSGIDVFAFFLLAGVVPWNLFGGGLGAAVGSVSNAGSLITRVWFPRELLPLASILALGYSAMIETGVLVAAVSVTQQVMILHLLPVLAALIALQVLFTAGVSMWLAACNVKYKDVEYLTSVILLAYFYLTPVLYPVDMIPEKHVVAGLTTRDISLANPMARFVMAFRNIVYDVRMPGLETMLWVAGWSLLVFFLGFRFFARRADYFAEAM